MFWIKNSCCRKCNNCRRRQDLPGRVLQPRRHPLGRLSRQLQAWHPIPHLGDQRAARASRARLHDPPPALRAQCARAGGCAGARSKDCRKRGPLQRPRPRTRRRDCALHADFPAAAALRRGTAERTQGRRRRRASAGHGCAFGDHQAQARSRRTRPGHGSLRSRMRAGPCQPVLGNLDQSVFGKPAYATIESKAAHLLYFVIKNHPFADGNKRIGSFLFVEFLHRNGRLLRHGQPVLNDVGLAALALLVAESAPKDKDVMIRLVMNMLAEPGE